MGADRLSNVAVARLAAAAALEAPEVLELHDGAVGEIATYGQGVRVRGVRVRFGHPPRIRVHLVVRIGARLEELAEDVRTRVWQALERADPELIGTAVDVHIADIGSTEQPPLHQPIEEAVRWS